MMFELKPCPFCGGQQKVGVYYDGIDYVVWCKNCGAQAGGRRTGEKAIDAWNRREGEQNNEKN